MYLVGGGGGGKSEEGEYRGRRVREEGRTRGGGEREGIDKDLLVHYSWYYLKMR